MNFNESICEKVLEKTVTRAAERNVILPTFAQQRDPSLISADIRRELASIGLWDVNPRNLFRITWKNEPTLNGGGFNQGNWIEFPPELTGVSAHIVGLVGKFFPTGAHKVGAAYGCLAPRLVSGQFDPLRQKAVWPSTGNYCRGGAYDCALLACPAVAILPEEMSPERFAWLREIGTDEIFATPGCESNVKEIYDLCWKLRRERGDAIVILNQFEEFGNSIWHYQMTGGIIEEIFQREYAPRGLRMAAYISATGSAGTIAAGDFLRTRHPDLRVCATEALQCPTLYQFGFGGHRIEGIGDKHIPWIHNVRNTDMVAAVDDERTMQLFRLFNTEAGRRALEEEGVAPELTAQLDLLGISCVCNLIACIKAARYYDLDSRHVLFTPLTDSAELYASRLGELEDQYGPLDMEGARRLRDRWLRSIVLDHLRELTYADRKALHNFKYFTWIEQQGRNVDELRELWDEDTWRDIFSQERVDRWDSLIEAFNTRVRERMATLAHG